MSVTSRALVGGVGRRRLIRGSLLSVVLAYVAILLVLPVAGILITALRPGMEVISSTFGSPQVLHAYYLTGIITLITVVITSAFGVLVAWVLTRDRFPGRSVMNALVDLPFAVSPVTVGVMAVLLELDEGEEEAAYLLGARGGTVFRKVILPALRPAIIAGALLTFARALGEFGSIVIVSGNLPGTLTSPVYIFQLTSQFRYEEAAVIATVLFSISFLLVLVTDRLLKRGSEAL